MPVARDELGLALHQLIENALLHNNAQTQVEVVAKLSENMVVISVRDTGVGIGKQHLEFIFNHTYRVDDARHSETGGTGLGLSMVRKVVELHHGSINVISEVGQGTEFIMKLPLVSNEWR